MSLNPNSKISNNNRSLIDVHHHILPSKYLKLLADAGITSSMDTRFPKWSVNKDIEIMDQLGISTAIISISSPAANVKGINNARLIARECNEIVAKMINDHCGRYGAFATLPPLTDVEGALSEIEYTLDTLQFDGVTLMTNYYLKYLGDSSFEEIYAALNRRKAVVYIHPNDPPGVQLNIPGSLMDAPFDTTRAATSLICTGTMERYPNISFILSHGGGTLPYIYFRIKKGVSSMWKGFHENAPKGFQEYLNRFYYDTAMVGPDAFQYLCTQISASKILIGTDFPFIHASVIDQCLKGIVYLKEEDVQAIKRNNAIKLFPKLLSRD